MSRRKSIPITPPPPLTPEQEAAAAERRAAHDRRIAEIDAAHKNIRAMAERLAPAFGGRVTSDPPLYGWRVEVMFGAPTQHTPLGFSGPGLAEAELEVDYTAAVEEGPIRVRTRFQSYATSGNTTADECEAQGQALLDAARFTRTLLAAVGLA